MDGGDDYMRETSSSSSDCSSLTDSSCSDSEDCPDDLPVNANCNNPQDLLDIIEDARKTMQDPAKKKRNGVTIALLGSSGCGKSTVIRKIFVDAIYGSKDYITSIHTNSSTSDAFAKLPKDVIVFPVGLDHNAILYCYHTNSKYEKKYNFVNILDDVLGIRYDTLVRDMFLIYRNTNITSVVSVQYPKLVPVAVRSSVYFTFAFDFNNEEAIEIIVRGWMQGYLEGDNIQQKMETYREWSRGGQSSDSRGHRFFLLDNLHHTAYCVTEDYICYELAPVKRRRSGDKTSSLTTQRTRGSIPLKKSRKVPKR